MSQLGASLKETLGGGASEFPWSASNLPKQLFINNEVRASRARKIGSETSNMV